MISQVSLIKRIFKVFIVFTISLLLSCLLSAALYYPATSYIKSNNVNTGLLLMSFLYVFVFLLTVIFILLYLLFEKIKVEQSQRKELKNYREFTEQLHHTTSEKEVYRILHDFLSKLPLVSHVSVFYAPEKNTGDDAWIKYSNESIPLCNMNGRICPVAKDGTECVVKEIQSDLKCAYQLKEYRQGSYFCMPISDGTTQVVVRVYSRHSHAFDDLTLARVRSYIDASKPVLFNRKEFFKIGKQASTDMLTKLYNRSFVDPYLENQIETSQMLSQNLSLIMVDIDHFKKVNDTYGHPAGDHVLSFFADILIKCTRKTDLVSRYGGEEFLIVLPSTNTETAYSIAERIRQTVAGTSIPPLNKMIIPNISCSLGISTYPFHGKDKSTLIKSADTALYVAKETGRNCARIFEESMKSN